MRDELRADGWRVRVRGAYGAVVGAAVMISPDLALTCAHVVAAATGGDQRGAAPGAAVALEFPGAAAHAPRPARVLPGGWVPVDARERGDLAVLRLDAPAGAGVGPAPLDAGAVGDRLPVRVFGHPAGDDSGVWATAETIGRGGPGNEWIQVAGVTVPGRRIEPGFSGAGVVDRGTGRVIGLVVSDDRLRATKVAWMVPLSVCAGYWPPLSAHLRAGRPAPRAGAGPVSRAAVRRIAAAAEELSCLRTVAQRDAVVAQLRPEVRRSVPRQSDARFDVLSIVDTTAAYELLPELLEVLRELEGDSPARRRLDAVVGQEGADAVPGAAAGTWAGAGAGGVAGTGDDGPAGGG